MRRPIIAVTPLEKVEGLTDEDASKLREVWITTAEQLVALAATGGGMTSIAQQLHMGEDRARRLVDSARAALSPQMLAELDRPADTSEYGLGVLRPRPENGDRDDS